MTLAFDAALRARAHANLAEFARRAIPPDGRRPAAVAVVLLPDDEGRACFLLTRRAARLRAHSRQWALPGGGVDQGESAEAAALREMREEVGLTRDAGSVLGLLDDYGTRSGYIITPVVVWGGADAAPVANPDEVASVHLVPLADLDHPDVPRLVTIPESDRPVIQVPILSTNVHAPTAAVLYQLREEVGLSVDHDAVLGLLDDYGTRSGYIITPVVVWGGPDAAPVANPDEVASVHLVPLADLEHPDVPRLVTIPESDRPVIQVPILSTLVHAPTAAVVYQLREVVVHGRATRVDHFEQPVWAW